MRKSHTFRLFSLFLQTEHAAAELLANAFDQKFQAGGTCTQQTAPAVGGASLQAGHGSIPHSVAVTHLSLPTINTTTLRPSGGSLPKQTFSSPRSRNNNSLRPRGNRGGLMSPTSGAGAANTSARGIHPVIRLGWKPVCSVVCNGLRGEFLGGHDRDMFMKATSGHYAGLPLIDVSLGGCIMTCSQFERYAGRELSKKWKESIHVVGEGEGSRATLLSWLKRKAEQDFGAQVVGKQIWVCWCADAEYYQGTIVSYNREGGKHTVQYSSRLSEDLHLAVERISFEVEKPTLPAASAAAMPGAGAASGAEVAGVVIKGTNGAEQQQLLQHQAQHSALSAPAGVNTSNTNEDGVALHMPATAAGTATGNGFNNNTSTINLNPLWHQNSGISVTSSYADELRGNAALVAMATGARGNKRASGNGGGNGGGKVGSHGNNEGINVTPRPRRTRKKPFAYLQEDDIAMPPPKRALSAPAAVLLAEAAAAAAALAATEQQQQQEVLASQACHQNQTDAVNLTLPVSPLSLSMPSPLLMPLPPPPQSPPTPLGALAGSGAAAESASLGKPTPETLAKAVVWMHDIALSLDQELEETERATKTTSTPETTTAATNKFSFISPSGRFQALLALLGSSPACLYGIFESMVRRYNHFAGNPQLQRQKLVELMLATLIEAAAPRDLFKSVEADAIEKKSAEKAETGERATAYERPNNSPSPSLLNNAKMHTLNNNPNKNVSA